MKCSGFLLGNNILLCKHSLLQFNVFLLKREEKQYWRYVRVNGISRLSVHLVVHCEK